MNVTLRQLRAFVAIARTGSFSEAAQHLHLTQSALSGQIKELEGALGLRVFDRTTRRISVSKMGGEFLPLATRLLDDLDHSLAIMSAMKALDRGRVYVAAPQLLACTLLPKVLGAFAQAYPQIEVVLRDVASDSVLPRLRGGDVDIALGGERAGLQDIESELLFELPFLAVTHPDHPFAGREQLTWDDLANEKVITVSGMFTQMLKADLEAASATSVLTAHTEVSYLSTALSLVNEGLGVTICQPYAKPLVSLYGLTSQVINKPVISRRFYVFSQKGRAIAPATQAFREFLKAFVAQNL